MKEYVQVVNGARWTKDGKNHALLNLIFTSKEALANNPNFFGGQLVVVSVNPTDFDTLRLLAMKKCEAEITFENNAKNPLKPIVKIKSLKTEDGKVTLLS